ncbi:MAG: thiamine pyrophosphate-dependent enzyme, partial [Croceimicrobium sp.]
IEGNTNDWLKQVLNLESRRAEAHQKFIEDCPFSDLKAYDYILKHIPKDSVLHCANSAGIRYAQLFDQDAGIRHYANRGTSGIDGSTSTAIGHATVSKSPVSLISGDIAFQYDNAAFWNDRLPANLKLIIINNQGGNIFRIIKGPDQVQEFERFQETQHHLDLSAIAKLYGINYRSVDNEQALKDVIAGFFDQAGLEILEIKTPRKKSPEVLKAYFSYLKEY